MGEPAELTAEEMKELTIFAAHVVTSVLADLDQPQPRFADGDAMPDDVMIFKLAQMVLAVATSADARQRVLEALAGPL